MSTAVPRPPGFPRFRLSSRQLVLLVHLYNERSVLRASAAAHMTQPAASKLLAGLEDALGVTLFERHARGVEPTAYGDIMVRYARNALRGLVQAQDEIAALTSGLAGQASVGTVVNPSVNLVPLAVAALKRKHPRILVRIEIGASNVLVERLAAGELDTVVARMSHPASGAELRFERLAEESHVVVGRGEHPLRKRRGMTIADLEDQAWILPPAESVLRQRLHTAFASNGLRWPANVVEATSFLVVTSLLQKTDMIAPLQEEIVRPYCTAGLLTVLPVDLNVRMESFGILTRRDDVLSPGAAAMVGALRDTASRLYGPGSTKVVHARGRAHSTRK